MMRHTAGFLRRERGPRVLIGRTRGASGHFFSPFAFSCRPRSSSANFATSSALPETSTGIVLFRRFIQRPIHQVRERLHAGVLRKNPVVLPLPPRREETVNVGLGLNAAEFPALVPCVHMANPNGDQSSGPVTNMQNNVALSRLWASVQQSLNAQVDSIFLPETACRRGRFSLVVQGLPGPSWYPLISEHS